MRLRYTTMFRRRFHLASDRLLPLAIRSSRLQRGLQLPSLGTSDSDQPGAIGDGGWVCSFHPCPADPNDRELTVVQTVDHPALFQVLWHSRFRCLIWGDLSFVAGRNCGTALRCLSFLDRLVLGVLMWCCNLWVCGVIQDAPLFSTIGRASSIVVASFSAAPLSFRCTHNRTPSKGERS